MGRSWSFDEYGLCEYTVRGPARVAPATIWATPSRRAQAMVVVPESQRKPMIWEFWSDTEDHVIVTINGWTHRMHRSEISGRWFSYAHCCEGCWRPYEDCDCTYDGRPGKWTDEQRGRGSVIVHPATAPLSDADVLAVTPKRTREKKAHGKTERHLLQAQTKMVNREYRARRLALVRAGIEWDTQAYFEATREMHRLLDEGPQLPPRHLDHGRMLKGCDCSRCASGLHTKSGKAIARKATRAMRQSTRHLLKMGCEDIPERFTIGYTD